MTTKTTETEALNLDTLTETALRCLIADGYLARKWGAVPGMKNSEFYALTFNGECLFHLV